MAAGVPIAGSGRAGPSLGRAAYLALVALVFLFMFTPLIFVVWVSVFQNEVVTFPPQGYTLRWFGNAWANPSFLGGFLTSIQIGAFSMLAGLVPRGPAGLSNLAGGSPRA